MDSLRRLHIILTQRDFRAFTYEWRLRFAQINASIFEKGSLDKTMLKRMKLVHEGGVGK
jgi:hypothetical protein